MSSFDVLYSSREKLVKTVMSLTSKINNLDSGSLKIETKSGATVSFNAKVDRYYRCTSSGLSSLSITLPAMGSVDTVKGLVVSFTTDSNPTVTITSADSKTISYFSGYSISASTSYELNIIYNGNKWIVGYGIID